MKIFQITRVKDGRMQATSLVAGLDTETALYNFVVLAFDVREPSVSRRQGKELIRSEITVGDGGPTFVCVPYEEATAA